MSLTIKDVMTPDPASLPDTTTVLDAARVMRDSNIGDVIVLVDDDLVCGIVTDRDITVRAVASGESPAEVTLGDICSRELTVVPPTSTVEDAVHLMRDKALRRLPVIEGGKLVGIISLGDLAIERDPDSALADISAARPNA